MIFKMACMEADIGLQPMMILDMHLTLWLH